MKKWIYLAIVLFVLSAGYLNTKSAITTGNISDEKNPEANKINIQGLAFFTEVEPGLLDAKSQGKHVFVYARSKYCGACKQFEAETFTNSSVIDKLNKDFILISIDVDEQKTETRNFRLRVTPTEIFLDPAGTEIKRFLGYRTNQTFLDEINKIAI